MCSIKLKNKLNKHDLVKFNVYISNIEKKQTDRIKEKMKKT